MWVVGVGESGERVSGPLSISTAQRTAHARTSAGRSVLNRRQPMQVGSGAVSGWVDWGWSVGQRGLRADRFGLEVGEDGAIRLAPHVAAEHGADLRPRVALHTRKTLSGPRISSGVSETGVEAER